MESDIRTEKTEVQIAPFPFPFVIQSITEGENKAIRRSCQKTDVDKRTRQRRTETDTDLVQQPPGCRLLRGTQLQDAALQEKYGVRGAEDLINRLLNPGQYTDLLLAIQEINGFSDDINDLREEAKN